MKNLFLMFTKYRIGSEIFFSLKQIFHRKIFLAISHRWRQKRVFPKINGKKIFLLNIKISQKKYFNFSQLRQ